MKKIITFHYYSKFLLRTFDFETIFDQIFEKYENLEHLCFKEFSAQKQKESIKIEDGISIIINEFEILDFEDNEDLLLKKKIQHFSQKQ